MRKQDSSFFGQNGVVYMAKSVIEAEKNFT